MLNMVKSVLFGGLSLMGSLSVFAVTYVKPDATGEESGASWAEATSLEAAIQKGGVIYAAKGVYYPAATLQLTDGIQLYGGFAGTGDEAPDARDFVNNQTIICGDTGRNDVWTMLYPEIGASATSTTPIIKDGKINIPVFSDNYETCFNSLSKNANLSRLATIAESAIVTVDGVIFAEGGYNDYPGVYVSKSGVLTITNCRFVACSGAFATLYVDEAGVADVTGCSFEHCMSHNYGVVGAKFNYTSITVTDCEFIGNYRNSSVTDKSGAAALYNQRKTTVSGCFFTRNYNKHTNANNTMESVCIGSSAGEGAADKFGANFTDCTMVYNSAYDTTGTATPMMTVRPHYCTIKGAVIASNRVIVASSAASVVAASAVALTDKPNYEHLDSFSIFDNELTVTATAATTVDAAPMTLVLDGATVDLTVLNSTFSDNEVSIDAPATASVNWSRGILMRGSATSEANRGLAVFNCVFTGSTDGPDIVYGGSDAEGAGCIVYNDVLWATGAAAETPRVVSIGTAPVQVGYGVVRNPELLDDAIAQTAIAADDPLLGAVAVLVDGKVPSCRLGAALPGVRTTCDVSSGLYYEAPAYRYRLPDSSSWVQPFGHYYGAFTPAYVASALGETRTARTFTIGAVQALDPLAETGHTYVLRLDPEEAGRVEGGRTQVIAADGQISLAAVSTNSAYSFNSWRTLEGDVVSTDNPYVISAPGQGTTVLVARFNPASVTYAFDLGEHGTFDVCGLAVTNVTFRPDDPVVVPAHTLEADYAIRRWSPELPLRAGPVDASFAAEYVTRVTRVETDGDLSDALAAAAVYPGEAQVLLAGGTHELAAAVTIPGNVTLVGEDGAVLKGASKQKWAIDGTADEDLSAAYCISNVTFVGSGVQPGLRPAVFTDCVFSNATAGGAFAALLAYTNVTCTGCTFADNVSTFHVICLGSSLEVSCTFADCSFVGNRNGDTSMSYSGRSWLNNGIVSIEGAIGFFTNCEFRANVNSKSAGARGVIYANDSSPVRVVGSCFEDNVVTNGYQMIHFGYYADGQYVKDSMFLGNRVVGGTGATGQSSLLRIQQTGKVQLNGNSFVSNVVDRVETGDKTADAMLVFAQGYLPKFLNCYFEGNRIRARTASGATVPKAALVCLYGTIGGYDYGCCNNTFYNNDAPDGCFNIASNMDGTRDNKWRFSNCIFRDTAGTKPFVYSAEATMRAHVVNCILTPVEDDRIVYAGCQEAALAFDSLRLHKGRLVRPVSPWSVLRQTGATVERDKDNHCVWVTVGGSRVIALGSTGGYLPNNPPFTPIEDMFGVYDGRNICGAYRKIPSGKGLVILLR